MDEPTGDGAIASPHGCILRVTPAHGRFVGRVYTPDCLADVNSRASAQGAGLTWPGFQQTAPLLELFARHDTSAAAPPVRYITRAVVCCPADGGPANGLSDTSVAATASANPAVGFESVATPALIQQCGLGSSGASSEAVDSALFMAFSSALVALPRAASDAIYPVPFPSAPVEMLQRVPASLLRLGLHQFLLQYSPAAPKTVVSLLAPSPSRLGAATAAVENSTVHEGAAAKWRRVAGEVLKKEGLRHSPVLVSTDRAEQPFAAPGLLMDEAQLLKPRVSRFVAACSPQALPSAPLVHTTRFTRIDPRIASGVFTDPFSAHYLGAFGPHGPEVLQLARGRWGDGKADEECVTAVKLTGDDNVPAGRASFRARVGRAHRLDPHGAYPEELGVLARYKGQGRAAKPGFSDPRWVDGELLLLDGNGGALTGGAELGFVWTVPGERRCLILLSRLKLPA